MNNTFDVAQRLIKDGGINDLRWKALNPADKPAT